MPRPSGPAANEPQAASEAHAQRSGPPGLDLAIETSTRQASMALRAGDVCQMRALQPEAAHASDLLPLLDELLREVGAHKQDLARLHVGIGPGSFTGLRVGAAVALGLAQALPVELVAVPSVEAVAWAHLAVGETGSVVLDARSGALYVATFERGPDALIEHLAPTRVPLSQAPALDLAPGILLGDARAAEWFGVQGDARWTWRAEAEPNALDLLALGIQRWLREGPSQPEAIRPLYLAPFGA